ncbi:MAG: hypothetical protein KDB88_11905 [Flavobacteriales bacterium]|nr:hypothetical protein [Flavobacteriales bacterium]
MANLPASAQTTSDTLNQVDAQGRKTGVWRFIAPVAEKPGYQDGQLIEEGTYASGRRVGVWQRYWPNGKLMSRITYAMGRPRGPYAIYYPNGQIEEEGTWDLDRNTGAFRRWHPNGKPSQEFVFDPYGVRNGVQRYYHENGQLAVEVEIKDGREDGTLERYYANGDLQQQAVFHNGVIDQQNSRYLRPVHRDAPVEARSTKPAPTVSKEEKTNAVVFRENGYNTMYDRQLRLSQTGQFKNGQLWDGKVYRYDANGHLIRIETYRSGRYVGDAVITEEDLP